MVELDDQLGELRTELQRAVPPDFDDVLRRRRRHVRRQAAGVVATLAVVGAVVPVALHALPDGDAGRDSVTPAGGETPTSPPSSEPTPGPSVAVAYPALEPVVSDCGRTPYTVRPTTLTLSCADGGIVATHLVWTSWGATTAEATGTAHVRDVTPGSTATDTAPIRLVVTSTLAADAGAGTTPTAAPVIRVFDDAQMTFTGAPPAHWTGDTTTGYPLPAGGFSADQLAVAMTVTTFWDAAVPAATKTGFVEGGAEVKDITQAFSLLPPGGRVDVSTVTVTDDTATATFFDAPASGNGGSAATTWALVKVSGRWLVHQQSWTHFVTRSEVHGSG